jgi:hypothetical protein
MTFQKNIIQKYFFETLHHFQADVGTNSSYLFKFNYCTFHYFNTYPLGHKDQRSTITIFDDFCQFLATNMHFHENQMS